MTSVSITQNESNLLGSRGSVMLCFPLLNSQLSSPLASDETPHQLNCHTGYKNATSSFVRHFRLRVTQRSLSVLSRFHLSAQKLEIGKTICFFFVCLFVFGNECIFFFFFWFCFENEWPDLHGLFIGVLERTDALTWTFSQRCCATPDRDLICSARKDVFSVVLGGLSAA